MWRWGGGLGCCGGGFGVGWWGILNIVFGLIFLAAIVIAVVWTLRRLSYSKKPWRPIDAPTPEIILKQRYARGEISREEYLAMLEDLKG